MLEKTKRKQNFLKRKSSIAAPSMYENPFISRFIALINLRTEQFLEYRSHPSIQINTYIYVQCAAYAAAAAVLLQFAGYTSKGSII